MNNKPTEEQIQEVLSGTSTPEVARLVAQWFATDGGSAYVSRRIDDDARQIKPGYEELYVNHEIPTEELWNRITSHIRRKRIRRISYRVAAVLIPFLFLVGLYMQVESQIELFGNGGYEEIHVAKGDRMQMMFQDGTRVYLNSDSHLKYPKKFALLHREVHLKGEAYFVVSPNKKRPFIVNLDGPAIRVHGTSFNVKAYPENEDITVCLDEGSVSLATPTGREYPLHPGEKMIYNKENGRCDITRNEETVSDSSWRKNVISLKGAPLSEVMNVLGRWYDVSFKTEGDITPDVLFTLTSENAFLENVLQDLEKISPLRFRYDESKKEVTVCSQ